MVQTEKKNPNEYSWRLSVLSPLASSFVVACAFTHRVRNAGNIDVRDEMREPKRFYSDVHVSALHPTIPAYAYGMEWNGYDDHTEYSVFELHKRYQFSKGRKNCYFVWIARTEKEASHASYSLLPKNRNRRFYYTRILIYLIFCYKVHKNVPRPRSSSCRKHRNGQGKRNMNGMGTNRNDGSVGIKYIEKPYKYGYAGEFRFIYLSKVGLTHHIVRVLLYLTAVTSKPTRKQRCVRMNPYFC